MNILLLSVISWTINVQTTEISSIVKIYDDHDRKRHHSNMPKGKEEITQLVECTRKAWPLFPIALHRMIESYHEYYWIPVAHMTDQTRWLNFRKPRYTCLAYMKGVFAAGNSAGTIETYDINTSKLTQRVQAHSGSMKAMTYDPEEQYLYTCAADRRITLWSPNWFPKTSLNLRDAHAMALLLFKHNTLILGDSFSRIAQWDVQSEKPEYLFIRHLRSIESLVKLNDKCFVSSSLCGEINLFDISTQKTVLSMDNPGTYYNKIVVLNEHQFAMTKSASIVIYDIRSNKELSQTYTHINPISAITMLGNRILSGSEDGTVSIFDPCTLKITDRPTGPRVNSISNKCVACESITCKSAPHNITNIMALAADPDGSNFVSATADPVGTLTHWRYTHARCGK